MELDFSANWQEIIVIGGIQAEKNI